MRTRTLLAAATLAVLTLAWSAPAALAKDNDDGGSAPPTTTTPAGQPQTGATQRPLRETTTTTPTPEPAPPVATTTHTPPPVTTRPGTPPPVSTLPAPASPMVRPGPILSDPHARLSVSPGVVRPGDSITADAQCQGGQVRSLTGDGVSFTGTSGRVDPGARDGGHTVTLVCANGPKTDTATAQFQVNGAGPPGGDLHATLSVSPRLVRQGDVVYFNGGCDHGRQVSLDADEVAVRGNRGYVDDNAREGEHTATRVCTDGHHQETATDHFRVIPGDHGPGDRPGPWDFWLSERAGYRGDSVDAAVRCHDNAARLESDALDDITLHRDGGRLVGTTHVVGHVGSGWHRVTVSCDGHREDLGFWVLSEHGDHDRYLSIDPSYGHPGDEVDIHVGCDREVGRVESDALDDIDLDQDGPPWRYSGTTHVTSDAEPGEHSVRVRCGDDTLEESFFVQSPDNHNGDGGNPGGGDQVPVYPQGAPETGGGPVPGASNPATGPDWTALSGLGAVVLAGGAALARRTARREARR